MLPCVSPFAIIYGILALRQISGRESELAGKGKALAGIGMAIGWILLQCLAFSLWYSLP
jgi:hypothetical protein